MRTNASFVHSVIHINVTKLKTSYISCALYIALLADVKSRPLLVRQMLYHALLIVNK